MYSPIFLQTPVFYLPVGEKVYSSAALAAFSILPCPVALLDVQCFLAFEYDFPSPQALT